MTKTTNEITISYSKIKISLAILGSLTFVVFGIMILMDKDGMTSLMFRSEVLNKVIALAAILFFGTVCITIPKKLLQKNGALIINNKGITDYSNLSSIGLIEWEDITGIRTVKVQKTRFFLIDVNKPKKYIDKAKSGFKRKLLKGNAKVYKTPLSITLTTLNVKFNDLENILFDAYERHGKKEIKTHHNKK